MMSYLQWLTVKIVENVNTQQHSKPVSLLAALYCKEIPYPNKLSTYHAFLAYKANLLCSVFCLHFETGSAESVART